MGDKVREVTHMLSMHACTDHVTENGDAAFLPIGTVVYELKGYKAQFRTFRMVYPLEWFIIRKQMLSTQEPSEQKN